MPRHRTHVLSRRGFLGAAMAATAGAAILPRFAATGDSPLSASLTLSALEPPTAPRTATLRLGYAAITWGGADDKAVQDIASLGFRGIQLRNTAVDRWGANPEELRRLLSEKGLRFQVLSSGSVDADPAREAEYLEKHVKHARFAKAAGAEFIQILTRRPERGTSTPAEYERLGKLLNTLGQRTRELGIPLVYHNHMKAMSERPEELVRVLEATDPKALGLLFDIAHYTQGGGDPVKGLLRHKDRLAVVHLKDVVSPVAEIAKDPLYSYKFVELGRGKVDVPGVVETLHRLAFKGPVVIELDAVTDPSRTPKDCAAVNKQYAVSTLGLAL
jgi:inosose dehydratase